LFEFMYCFGLVKQSDIVIMPVPDRERRAFEKAHQWPSATTTRKPQEYFASTDDRGSVGTGRIMTWPQTNQGLRGPGDIYCKISSKHTHTSKENSLVSPHVQRDIDCDFCASRLSALPIIRSDLFIFVHVFQLKRNNTSALMIR
jgi:hypothetical protein